MQNIFVYGTLLFPEILKSLTGKSFKTSPAVLPGYKIHKVKDNNYPAIIQYNDSITTGLIIENMDDLSFRIISFYEGDEYTKRKLNVVANNESVGALAFVWVKETDLLAEKEWDLSDFKQKHLGYYLNVLIPETLKYFHQIKS